MWAVATGNYTLTLAQRGVQATGVDLSPAMLGVAISKAKKTKLPVRYVQAVIENLPFPAESEVILIYGEESDDTNDDYS